MAARHGGELRRLDFGAWPAAVTDTVAARAGLRLAPAAMAGPGKYRILAERRRRAQIRARHALGVDAWAESAQAEAATRAGVGQRAARHEEVR